MLAPRMAGSVVAPFFAGVRRSLCGTYELRLSAEAAAICEVSNSTYLAQLSGLRPFRESRRYPTFRALEPHVHIYIYTYTYVYHGLPKP